MDYTSEQLNSLISQVEKEFNVELAKAEKNLKLAKNEDEQPKDKKMNGMADDKKNSAKDEKTSASENKDGGRSDDNRNDAKDEKQSSEDRSKEAAKDDSGKPKEGESSEDKGVKDQNQQADDKAGEGHGYDDEDMQHMHSMYSSMSSPELKAHHDCIRKCMDGMAMSEPMVKAEMEDGAKDAEGYRPNGGPKDGQGEAEGKGPKASDKQALEKSEPSIEVSLLKSELEAVKAKADKGEKELKAVEAFLKKFVEKTAPTGKAITSLDIIAKTEDAKNEKVLTKSEIDAKLQAKSRDGSTSTDDRKAINSYYFSKNLESVRHLLS